MIPHLSIIFFGKPNFFLRLFFCGQQTPAVLFAEDLCQSPIGRPSVASNPATPPA
jgi:hypothetical protein